MMIENNEDEIIELEKSLEKNRKKEPSEVIEIRHTDERTPSGEGDLKAQLAEEKRRREELEVIVGIEAEKSWEIERDSLLQKVPESRREAIKNFISDDPEKLNQIKASMILQGQIEEDEDESEEKTPSGRARLPEYMLPPDQRGQVRSPTYSNPTIQKYSDLYAILRSPTSTEEQKNEANQILDETFVEIRKGLQSRAKNNPYTLPTGVVTHCWFCGAIVEADLTTGIPCPYCGKRFGIDPFPRNPHFQPK